VRWRALPEGACRAMHIYNDAIARALARRPEVHAGYALRM